MHSNIEDGVDAVRLEALPHDLGKLSPEGWRVEVGDGELIVSPAQSELGCFCLTWHEGSPGRLQVAFRADGLGRWLSFARFDLEDDEMLPRLLAWCEERLDDVRGL